jgi:membrane-associated phospholipid phosphatase
VTALKKIDIIFLIYLVISTVLLVFTSDSSVELSTFIWFRLSIVLSVIALIYTAKKNNHPIFSLLRLSYPLILSGYFYSETVFYNKLFFKNIDPFLVKIETTIFGMQPSLEFSACFPNKLFSELMYFAYFFFYVLILGFTLYMFVKRRNYFNKVTFQLIFSTYIFYLIFCFIPSAGPQFYFTYPESELPKAFFFDHIMHFIQRVAEQPTGAFPSSHVGISFIILMLSKKSAPEFYSITWPLVLLLILSTVYIKAHYAIDIIGGLIIAPFILYLSDFLYQLPAWKNVE